MTDLRYKYLSMIAGRISSLQSDGYILVIASVQLHSGVWKLRHRTNGRWIYIYASFDDGTMKQKSDNRITYSGRIQA